MSVESEILRIQHNIANTYAAVSEKGGEVPLQPNSANLSAAVASIPSGAILNAGDGLSKDGDTLNVDNPVRGIYTQAEFDAFTEDQKASGTYIVDDGQSGGVTMDQVNAAISAALAAYQPMEVYSTEEQRIGTWIDGRPLYRSAIGGTFQSTQHINFAIAPMPANADLIVRRYGYFYDSANSQCFLPMSGDNTSVDFYVNSLEGSIFAWGNIASQHYGRPFTLWLEYTKTTDSPEVTS